jgi:hypothetical protein
MPSADRVQAQASLNFNKAMPGIEASIKQQLIEAFSRERVGAQNAVGKAFYTAMGDLLSKGSANVTVFGSAVSATMAEPIMSSQLARAMKDSMVIGELGIPDPDAAMKTLADSLIKGVRYRVTVSNLSIQVEYVFNANQILGHNPHPGKSFPNGNKIGVDSWLQWIVGPKFDRQGTPDYGLVRVSQLMNAGSSSSAGIREKMASASRTFGVAGPDAVLMLRSRKVGNRGGRGQLTALKGTTGKPWKPRLLEDNFWTNWWKKNKPVFSQLAIDVCQAAVQHVITKMNNR